MSGNGFDDLLEHRELFSYMTADGNVEYHTATLLYSMSKNTDSVTEVGVDSILTTMETVKMSDFTNNADSFLKLMEQNFKVLKGNGQPPKNSVVFSWMLWLRV